MAKNSKRVEQNDFILRDIKMIKDEPYTFGKLRVIPCVGRDGNEYLKLYAENELIIHPISDNTVTIYDQK